MNRRNLYLYIGGGILGAVAGYTYYALIGCSSGSCAITSNPTMSTIYGTIFGLLIGSLFTSSRKKEKE